MSSENAHNQHSYSAGRILVRPQNPGMWARYPIAVRLDQKLRFATIMTANRFRTASDTFEALLNLWNETNQIPVIDVNADTKSAA
jgi:hypothetical protein